MQIEMKNGNTVAIFSDKMIDLRTDEKAIDGIVAALFGAYKELVNPDAELEFAERDCNRLSYNLRNGKPETDTLSFTYFLSRGYSVALNFLDNARCNAFFEKIKEKYDKKRDINYSC